MTQPYLPDPSRTKLVVPLLLCAAATLGVAFYCFYFVGSIALANSAALVSFVTLMASMFCSITAYRKQIDMLRAISNEHDRLLFRMLEDPANADAHRNEMNERIAKISGLSVEEIIKRGL